ncbi:MAG: ribonuclease HII [Bdellovibrionaceae bacterium]|nr:ribonuclease HII [Pseudobdellovibrionaceae bacterium]MBX3034871.1 ribonuclease HII [Pseudobdellovibrionaceae bacterium]
MKNSEWQPVDWRNYGEWVIGVDEVGRGCLAGPVYASAVLFTHGALEKEVTDSKKLTEKRREELAIKIREQHIVSLGFATEDEIDRLNILKASLLAMRRAVEGLTTLHEQAPRAAIVIDGNQKIPGLDPLRQSTLVKGDLRCAPISAASIVAKVTRDQLMKNQAVLYPGYGFEVHKGYLTAAHRAALQKQGPCAIHRKTFSGVKELLPIR